MTHAATLFRAPIRRHQAGLTLVELMVALVLGLLVAAAGVAALIVARQGFNSVDGSTQVRENVRFASSLIQRIAVQAGFHNVSYGEYAVAGSPPGIEGYDSAVVTIADPPALTDPTYTSGAGVNDSDALVIRFWGAGAAPNGDGSMINCAGVSEPTSGATDPAQSIFHIRTSTSGEPTLVCTYRNPVDRKWHSMPLVQGVESMQVLYGVDGVTPNAAPPAPGVDADSVPERYLHAAQLVVAGNATATMDNWRRVRSLRVGLVVRGPATGVADPASSARSYNVLGARFSSANDAGSDLVITTPDGRLRQQLVFNVHLRNPQDPQ